MDLILFNGDFRTQDPARPRIEAVAVAGGVIRAVGTSAEILGLKRTSTQLIDLQGRLALPGLTDSHFHFYDWALGRRRLELADVVSITDLVGRVSRAAKRLSRDRWVLGQGWNELGWPERRMPSRDDLDRAAPDHPVMLMRSDLHLAVVNSAALKAAGIDVATPDPPQGIISRDESGRPDGILRDLAVNLVKERIPAPAMAETLEAMEAAMGVLHRLGITGVHDLRLMGGLEGACALRAWQILDRSGRLQLRCWVMLPGERLEEAIVLGLRTGLGGDRLRIGHLKYFADGAMGARTAWLNDPYLDAGCGLPLTPARELADGIRRAEAHGLAVAVHAIGDRANHELINIFEALHRKHDGQGALAVDAAGVAVPHRIEHLQMIRPEDVVRLGRLKVVASVQPPHVLDDMTMIDGCLGDRGRWTYPFRSLLWAGTRVIFGSDCPVADPDPWYGIRAAVTRSRQDGTPPGGWYPEQRISVDQAVRCYTSAPHQACGRGQQVGTITVGKRADIAVFEHNVYTADLLELKENPSVLTIFDGRVVHARGAD